MMAIWSALMPALLLLPACMQAALHLSSEPRVKETWQVNLLIVNQHTGTPDCNSNAIGRCKGNGLARPNAWIMWPYPARLCNMITSWSSAGP